MPFTPGYLETLRIAIESPN